MFESVKMDPRSTAWPPWCSWLICRCRWYVEDWWRSDRRSLEKSTLWRYLWGPKNEKNGGTSWQGKHTGEHHFHVIDLIVCPEVASSDMVQSNYDTGPVVSFTFRGLQPSMVRILCRYPGWIREQMQAVQISSVEPNRSAGLFVSGGGAGLVMGPTLLSSV